MLRKLVNFVAGISLVVFVGNALLWRPRDGGQDFLTYEIGRTRLDASGSEGIEMGFASSGGCIRFGKVRVWQGSESFTAPYKETRRWCSSWNGGVGTNVNALQDAHSLLGLGITVDGEHPNALNVTGTVITIPCWMLAIVSGSLPAFIAGRWLRESRRELRHSRGLCPGCGYDLRASEGRCPECGAVIDRSK